jgi:hypothetical protein
MSDEFHGLPLVIDERVRATQLLDGNRPRKALGSSSLLLAQKDESCRGYLGPTARSKQSEVPHGMTVASGEVLHPPVDELLDCTLHRFPSVRLLILVPKPHKPVGDAKNALLREGRAPHIATSVAQEVFFFIGLHMRAMPCALLFYMEQTFNFIARLCELKLARLQRPAQKHNHQPLPAVPQLVGVKVDAR